MATADLTPDTLKKFLSYDATSGNFTRKINNGTAKAGDKAGWKEPNGYIKISIAGKKYYAHRCAFLFMVGAWPAQDVDHIDGNKANNSFANLRCVDTKTNTQNLKRARIDNQTGLLGVCYHRQAKKYVAECKGDNGQRIYLGLFNTAEEAHTAYLLEKRRSQTGCTI